MKKLIMRSFAVLALSIALDNTIQATIEKPNIVTFTEDVRLLQNDTVLTVNTLLDLVSNLIAIVKSFKDDLTTLQQSASIIIAQPLQAASEGATLGLNAASDAISNSALGQLPGQVKEFAGQTQDQINKWSNNVKNAFSIKW